nr:hypothetical protein [Tanacetum cinerariifolium]
MRSCLLFLCLYLSSLASYSQAVFGTEIISKSALSKGTVDTPKSYQGIYHFGESEAESDFALIVNEGIVTAQICSGEWTKNPERWKK